MDKFKEYIDSIWGRSYVWEQPWLELVDGECAKYTIRQYDDRLWHITWWHGNRGYEIGKIKKLEEAKEICVRHLEKIYNKIKAELGV